LQGEHTFNTEAHQLLELSYSLRESLRHLSKRAATAAVLILENIYGGC
jgi:hypothetical protein